jgi:DNA-binding NarL/FixJ family response regulator
MSGEQQKYRSMLVIDDHKMVIIGIRLLIGNQFRDYYQANSGAAGIALALQHQPQLVIVDYILPDMTGDLVVKEIKHQCPGTRILGYSFNINADSVLKMYEAGIHGYVSKNEDEEEFSKAVIHLLEGKDYFCKEARNHIIDRIPVKGEQTKLIVADTEFSAKEIGIIRLICQQKTIKEISRQVALPERTVEQYRNSIIKRIGAENVAGIIKFALKQGIIDVEDL